MKILGFYSCGEPEIGELLDGSVLSVQLRRSQHTSSATEEEHVVLRIAPKKNDLPCILQQF